MSEFQIYSRNDIGLPRNVTNSDGSLRPRMLKPSAYYTAHWPGVFRTYSSDSATVPATIRAIDDWAWSQKKPNEYNYVIALPEDNYIYEYAGEFRAAHSEGENGTAFGILLLHGIGQIITPTMVRKFQWLRDQHLTKRGYLDANVQQRRHKHMPGANTNCPGPSVDEHWLQMISPYNPPTEKDDVKMIALAWKAGTPDYRGFIWTGTELSWSLNGHAHGIALSANTPVRNVTDLQLFSIISSSICTSAAPPNLTVEMRQEWDKNYWKNVNTRPV